ncbi:MAG TPA: 2-oxo-tetronate isomerase [Dehalococcoidia bacterium]|jgi:hydroxypyruvate isomerase|nr:hydroxypyruvate isomerase family protein [Dehalococcoidia bacterium]MDP7262355.1 hydroxypyruvate isomerase family protein [Dehalococcoidia bacterium]MDP7484508.1 hydroxypyruvate isomerase family protein [Dehalococcoidia bacterium]HJP28832.1 2-oxo-tetronate isomerase [Dehalococcoidia bacterium]|tara:strand:+ start:9409 stop:10185 length:777 start_codon:yes stop_codon:yes gene_type:complete
MTRLAANLSLMFTEVEFLDRFEAAAKAGFKGVEYLFPYDFPAEQIKEKLDENGLTQVLFDFPAGDWNAGDRGCASFPDRVGEFQDGVGTAVEYAKVLGCDRLTVLAGKATLGVSAITMHETLIENLKFASRAVAGTDATILLEAINTIDISGYSVFRTNQSRAAVEAAGADNVKVQYDIYHMQIMEGDITRAIDVNLDVIGHFQLADNPGRHEPGTGEINYDFLLPYIDSKGYDGWIGCEYVPAGDTVAGLGWAAKYL